jgi:hypothetical protein
MTPPSLVLELATREGKTPLSWFVGDDHVTIVYGSGEKIRYDRDEIQPKPVVGARHVSPVHSELPKSLNAPIQKMAEDFIKASPASSPQVKPPAAPRRSRSGSKKK